jgi:nucleoside-diphosphate-sugar epimerase
MTRVFLTGATGNVGEPVLRELLSRSYEVTVLLRQPAQYPGCRVAVGSLAELDHLRDEIEVADSVIHLASPRGNTRDSVLQDDVTGTRKLLDAWRRGNFVYMSSQTVYGIPKQQIIESSPVEAMEWYDWGKISNEAQVRTAAEQQQGARRAGVSLRMALLIGAGSRRNDRQFLPHIFAQCLRGATFVFDSEQGLETYGSSFIGGQDLGRATVDALSVSASGPYNVAGGFCSWRELIETIGSFIGKPPKFVVRPSTRAGSGEHRLPQSRSFLETDAFHRQTQFTPRQTIEELVEHYVAAEHITQNAG